MRLFSYSAVTQACRFDDDVVVHCAETLDGPAASSVLPINQSPCWFPHSGKVWCFHTNLPLAAPLCEHRLQYHSYSSERQRRFGPGLIDERHQSLLRARSQIPVLGLTGQARGGREAAPGVGFSGQNLRLKCISSVGNH